MTRSGKDDLCWFHLNLSRDDSEQLIKRENPVNGTFLIRESGSARGDFVLTLFHENEVCHYQIRRHSGDAFFSIDDKVKILHGLESLVEFYQQAANGLPTKLSFYVKGDPPPNDARRHGSTNLLHRATKENNQTVVSELLKCGYRNADAKNQDGQTAIHLASMYSDEPILKLLLDAGVNVNCMDTAGFMPLHYACRSKSTSFIRTLIEAKANIQGRNIKNGYVPLHVAAEYGNLEAVKELLSHHAPLLSRTNSGEFPIDLANEMGRKEVVEYLNSYKILAANTSRNQWYHGTLKREEAVDALNAFAERVKMSNVTPTAIEFSSEDICQKDSSKELQTVDTSGCFLVRYSDRKVGSSGYVLTMLYNEQVKHFIISHSSNYLYIDEGPYLPSLEHLIEHFMRFNDGLPVNLKYAVPPDPKPPQPLLSTIPRCKNKRQIHIKPDLTGEDEKKELICDVHSRHKTQPEALTLKKKYKDSPSSVFNTLRKFKSRVTATCDEKMTDMKPNNNQEQTLTKDLQEQFPCKDLSFATNFSNLRVRPESDDGIVSAASIPSSVCNPFEPVDEIYKVPKNNTAVYPDRVVPFDIEPENKSVAEVEYFTKSDIVIEEERLVGDISEKSSVDDKLNSNGYIPTVDVRVFLDQSGAMFGDFPNEVTAAELRECSINPERLDSLISSVSRESAMLRYLNRQTSENSDIQNFDHENTLQGAALMQNTISCFIPPECLEIGTVIGEGEFGSVFSGYLVRCQNSQSGSNIRCEVAIKTLRDEHCRTNKQEFLREASVMIRLKHHCIVQLIGISKGSTLMMIQELVALGSMLTFIQTHKKTINPNQELKLWASQIACGMQYLEHQHFVHRDLAARNILLASLHQAKISDFGLSRALGSDNDFYEARQGGKWPVKWYAPESLKNGLFSHASDVWSFGITLWEMFSMGEPPYGDMRGFEAVQLIEEGKRLSQPVFCSDHIYNIMQSCWHYKPKDRPTFRYLTEFFTKHPDYQNIMELVKTNHIS